MSRARLRVPLLVLAAGLLAAALLSAVSAVALTAPKVTLTGPASVNVGQPATLSASVTTPAAPGENLNLEKLNGLTWVVVQSATLNASSQATFTVTPTAAGTTQYRAKIAATSTHAVGTSATYKLVATLSTPSLTLTGPAQVVVNTPGVLTATVANPPFPGDTVTLQRFGGVSWANAGTATLDASSQATFTVTPTAIGSTRYRATIAKTTAHNAVTSAEFVLNSVAKPPPDCGGNSTVQDNGVTWVCTYDDEFNGTSLDRSYWVPQVTETSGVINGDPNQYTCYVDSPQVINEHDGVLDLSMVRLAQSRSCYANGLLSSQYIAGEVSHYGTFSQTYGRYEVRAKLPSVTERGLQETLWLWPVDSKKYGTQKEASGEIDFAEFYSHYYDQVKPYVHYISGEGTNAPNHTAFCSINYGQFNTYRLEWEPGELKIYVNDVLCMTSDYAPTNVSSPAPFDQPFFLILTQAMGQSNSYDPSDNHYDPAVMPDVVTTSIDYARIWQDSAR